MKYMLLTFSFLFLSLGSFAQYGKLERIGEFDSLYVLRTQPEVLKQLRNTKQKININKAEYIASIERQLEMARVGYQTKRLPVINVQSFLNAIKYLENNGVDVNYYVTEYFFYYPKSGSRN